MPIYEFVCPSCGEQFEELAAAGTERADCPACGVSAQRVLSTFAETPKLVGTPRQRRRAEDRRGVGRDGARSRFKRSLRRARGDRGGS